MHAVLINKISVAARLSPSQEHFRTNLNAMLPTQLFVLWDFLHLNVGGISTLVVTSLICCIGRFRPSGPWALRLRHRETFTAGFVTVDILECNCLANFAIHGLVRTWSL